MGNQSTKHHLHAAGGGPKPKKFVHWKSAERPMPPGRPILIPVSDQQPDVITLKWNRPASDGGSPILGFIVEHRRTGSPHWVRATPGLVPRPEISMSGLEPGWRYQFRVIAENVVGKSDPSELSDPLSVTLQRNAISVPRFITELQDTTVVENDKMEMRVSFIGHPQPEINWFKDGFEIFSSRRTKILNESDSSTLIIHQAAFADEGEIKCTATNRAGHVATKAHLAIEAPPKIRLPRQYEDGLIFEAEEVVRLKVGIAGQPVPVVQWCHEGRKVSTGARYEIESSEKNTSLKITNIKRADRGEYSIKAANKLGEDIASFLVTVTSKPNPPGKVKLQMSFGRSATLTWEAPLDDGGCKIGNYIVEYFRIGWNVWLKAATTRKHTVTLHDLIEGSEYKFRVKAENPYGLSDPSDESDVLFIPDPSRGITKPQQIEHTASDKPVPPKRRNLSPLRNILGRKRDASPNRQPSPARNPGLLPEVFDSEDMKREMSYGTSNDLLLTRDSKKNSSVKKTDNHLEITAPPRRSPSPNRKSESNGNETLISSGTLKPEGINQRVQNFFRLSPLVARKNKVTEETQTTPRVSPSGSIKESHKAAMQPSISPTLSPSSTNGRTKASHVHFQHASSSPTIEKRHDIELSPRTERSSPQSKEIILTADINRSSESEQQQNYLRNIRMNTCPDREPESQPTSVTDHRRSLDLSNLDEQLNVAVPQRPRLSLPNPRIEISQANPDLSVPTTPKSRNNVHTSSEFMLVLYPNKKSQEHSKQDSFELDLEDSLAPPQLSLSAPDLGSDMQYLQELQLRRSASSTELLYERAMARFYEAVELEEAEKSKRRRVSQDQTSGQSNLTVKKRLGSMTEAERLSFERRNTLRGRLSGDLTQPLNVTGNISTKWDSRECLNLLGRKEFEVFPENNNSSLETQESEEIFSDENGDHLSNDSEFDEDYTESTASSDSIEKFKIELLARTQPPNPDLETYHPGRIVSGETFSPYRSPEPDQASVVLLKPLPMPNPDFVPKPILKRPSIDNNIKDSKEAISEIPDAPSPQPEEPQEAKITKPASKSRGFKSFFKRDKSSSDAKNKLKSKEPSSNDSSKESSPRQPSPKQVSPSQSFLEKSPSPNQLSPPNISPQGSISSPRQLSPVQSSPKQLLRKELTPKEMSPTGSSPQTHSPKQLSPKEMSPKARSPQKNSPKQLSPKLLSPKELSPNASDKKRTTQEKIDAFVQKQDEINERINKHREEIVRKKLESSKSAEEETKVVVDYYSHIVREMGSSRKDKKPLYLSGDDLMAAARTAEEEEDKARRNSIELKSNELQPSNAALAKHRLSIVERMQTAHVQEKSRHAMEQSKSIIGESQDEIKIDNASQPSLSDEKVEARGRSTAVPKKVKRRTASGSRSRDPSALQFSEKTSTEGALPPKRVTSRSRTTNVSKSPGAVNRRPIKRDPTPDIRLPLYVPPPQIEGRPQTPEEMSEEAQEKIRSTVSYATDVGLFVVACWVYLFKDARLVIPILALMVYRQIGEMIRERVPQWLPQKKNS